MENFVYSYPTKVYFGRGAAKEHLPQILSAYGPNVLLAYGGGSIKKNGIYEEITGLLKAAGKTVTEFTGIMSNPTYAKVQEGAKLARESKADLILAVGGGSVVDCCKIVAAQAVTDEDLWEMEMVRHSIPAGVPIPLGAIVTASGTGAEMNGGAVITNEAAKTKAGMFAAAPQFAVLDPSYTLSLPAMQVLSGAFDTLSHAMETYFGRSDRDNTSDEVAEAIMRNTITNMRTLLKDMNDYTARSNLMWTSAMAENGILKVGRLTDFECHQIEHQLGAYTDCNHGQGLAVIHPAYYRRVYQAAIPKFARFARNVWGISDAGRTEQEMAEADIHALSDFIRECGLPTKLTELRSKEEINPALLRKVADSCNLLQGGYKQLTHEDVYHILCECL